MLGSRMSESVADDQPQRGHSHAGAGIDRGDGESAPTVTMVSTPGDGSCGIGTYARDLCEGFDAVETEHVHVDQDCRSTAEILRLAVRVMATDSDVVHVQHEYGLFRREGVAYPGIMGLVLFPALYLLNLLPNKTIVVTLHSVLTPGPEEATRRLRLYLVLVHELIALTADHLVFLSAGCERRFRDHVALAPDEFSVFPHGVNAAAASDLPTAEAKAAFGFDAADVVVVIPGFIRPPKGHDVFVDVADRLPEYEFLIAGGARPKGEDHAFADAIADRAGDNVTVTGVLDDGEFPVALNAADLAFLPYRVVTQSGTFNWCAAHELPVLANEAPYFTRLERRWGNVETIDIGDQDAVGTRIRELVESDGRLAELRTNSRRFKRANAFQNVARAHHRLYVDDLDDSVPPEPRPTESPSAARAEPGGVQRAACSARHPNGSFSTEV